MTEKSIPGRRYAVPKEIERLGKSLFEAKWPSAKSEWGHGISYMPMERAYIGDASVFFGQIKVSEDIPSEDIVRKIDDLASSMESIKHELTSCKEAIDRLCEELDQRPLIKETKLFDIDEKLDVIQPIPIVIEEFRDEVIASVPEVELFAVANNEPEAISNLKTEIRDLYYELIETPKDELGKLPLSWLRVLERLIRKLGDA